MGLPIVPMLQIGLSAVGMFAQMSANNANARAEAEAAEAEYGFLYDDVTRRKGEVAQQHREAVSDRVMQANIEIANAELSAAERGVSASTRDSIIRNLATAEGIDIGRMATSKDSAVAALDSELKAGRYNASARTTRAANQARTQNTSAFLGAVGSGLQIYSGHQYQAAQLDALRNKT